MRTYNGKLSQKINAQLSRRERTVQYEKRLLALVGILVLSVLILLSTGIHAFASSQSDQKTVYKYYTSVRVENGDTLWSIANEYTDGYRIDKSDYIEEVRELNHLQNDTIHAGEHIVVAYYSTEEL